MIDDLILHDATRIQLDNFLQNPAHAVLLVGADGIGKTALAEALVCALLKIEGPKLVSYPHFMRLAPVGSSISIDAVRDIQRFLQLKTIGSEPLRRALLIEHAGLLTTEAQNAYLKLLEEPPADTVMVLTAHSPRALLPTILSRLQTITVHVPNESQLQQLMTKSGKDADTFRQAYFLSGGLPGLLCALISGDEAHPLLTSVATAKELLQKQPFERLCLAEPLSKQKEAAAGVLDALERIAAAGLQGAAGKGDAARLKQWHRIRKTTLEAKEALAVSANLKLTLSNLFLHL
jgi:replication-associated recombination protein RarA